MKRGVRNPKRKIRLPDYRYEQEESIRAVITLTRSNRSSLIVQTFRASKYVITNQSAVFVFLVLSWCLPFAFFLVALFFACGRFLVSFRLFGSYFCVVVSFGRLVVWSKHLKTTYYHKCALCWNRALANVAKRPAFSKSPVCTLCQNGYGA